MPFDDQVLRIPLSGGKDFALVDKWVAALLPQKNWLLKVDGVRVVRKYAGYNRWIKEKRYSIKVPMHRVIAELVYGAEALVGKDVDHADGNGLNNTLENLRVVTRAENIRNKRKTGAPRTSRFKGVSYDKARGSWRATIKADYKYVALGRFASEIDAARAYDAAAVELHGAYACLNFKEGL